VSGSPQAVGLAWAKWCWKAVRQFLQQRFDITLGRTACINWLHRLGFVRKRPGKRLLKADAEKRAAFVAEYQRLRCEAAVTGAKIFFVDEAHFRADVDVRQMWAQRGLPALVDSSSPRLGEKATYYSAVCLESGEVEAMPVAKTCTAQTTVAFLKQVRDHHTEPLIIIWDNGPAHRGPELRAWLTTPNLHMRLVPLPAYSPDFNADEAVWDWVREEATANICFGTKTKVQETVDTFFTQLACRTDEVKSRCRTRLQSRADELHNSQQMHHVDPITVSL
jgi:transposase